MVAIGSYIHRVNYDCILMSLPIDGSLCIISRVWYRAAVKICFHICNL